MGLIGLMTLILCLMLCPGATAQSADSGTFDTGVSWSLVDGDNIRFTGSGAVPDFAADFSDRPWGADVTLVTVGPDITHVGANAFPDCQALVQVMLGSDAVTFADTALPEGVQIYGEEWCCVLGGGELTAVTWLKTGSAATLQATVGGFPVTALSENALASLGVTQCTLENPAIVLPLNAFDVGTTVIAPEYSFVTAEEGVVLTRLINRSGHLVIGTLNGLKVTAVGEQALSGSSLTSLTLAEGVVSVGDHAFSNMPNLEQVSLPSTLREIGSHSFYYNSLTALTLPEGIETIGRQAFAESALTEVTIPDMDVLLGEQAFDADVQVTCGDWVYCIDGTEATVVAWHGADEALTVPDTLNGLTVTAFADGVFRNKTALTQVTLPAATDTLGNQLFYGCSALVTADLGDSAQTLGDQLFFGCRKLSQVTLPGVLRTVGRYAFANCVTISRIDLPQSVHFIQANAFRGCAALVEAPLPANLETIGDNAFYGCNSLVEVCIPDYVDELGEGLFTNCSALTTVEIGVGVKTIGEKTFAGLSNLKNLTVKGTDVSIAQYAFQNCTALQNVTLNTAWVGSCAFYDCTGLRTFRMEGGTIASACFQGCSLLEEVTLGSEMVSIPSYAFQGLTGLKRVTILGDVAEIPYMAFYGCTALEEAYLYAPAVAIGEYAFSGCAALKEFSMPYSVRTVGNYAFDGCVALENVELSDFIETIGSYAFRNCSALTEIELIEGLNYIRESAFAGCTGLTAVTMPSTILTVEKNAFPAAVRVYCDPASEAAFSISQNGGSFVSPDNEMFGIRLLLDVDISLGLSVEQIWTDSDAVTIPESIGGEPVTELGKNVFVSCPGVTTVTLPASVPVLPAEMLMGNQTLTNIIIPEGVTAIGASAFQDCTRLTSVTIPSTVTSIGANAFQGCTLLKEVQLGDSIQEIGENAFSDTKVYCGLDSDTARMLSRTGGGFVCREYPLLRMKYLFVGGEAVSLEVVDAEKSAAALTLPDSVTAIAPEAFQDMTALTRISLPEGLTSIGAFAFRNTGLTEVTLPAGVTRIENGTFMETAALKNVTVLGAVELVGESAFCDSGVEAVEFRDGLKSVGQYAFWGARSLRSAVLPDSVESLGYGAFQDCMSLVSFRVPAGVTALPESCFQNCSALLELTLPEGLESIGSYAVDNTGLASVVIPGTVKRIGSYAFYANNDLKVVSMSGDMDEMASYAFYRCTNLTRADMPDTLNTLGDMAFCECRALEEIVLPEGLKSVGINVFDSCLKLQRATLPEGLLTIPNGMFMYCNALRQVNLPSTLVVIENSAFEDCALEAVTIPDKVSAIGSNAFRSCDMTSLTLPDSVVSVGSGAFGECENLRELRLSAGMTTLENSTFNCCTALTSVSLPEGLRTLGYYAFGNCNNLSGVLIPASVESIDSDAFGDAYGLTVYCLHDTAAEALALSRGYEIIYLDGENVLEGLSIVANRTEISLGLNHTLDDPQALFTILPEDMPYQPEMLLYTEGDAAVLQDGVLLGRTVGQTELIAVLADNRQITASVRVNVRQNITDFTLPEEIWQLRSEPLTLLPASTVPENANDGYVWTLSEPIADISGNVLTPTACGTATLTATSWNGVTRSTVLHIYEEPTKIEFVNVPAGADVGTEIVLEPRVTAGCVFTGEEALHFLTYHSSDDAIASVTAQGVVTTRDYGTAVITATAENGETGEASIYVSAPITAFNLQGRILAPVGATIELAATEIEPANANPNAFTWVTEPEGLVSYANGRVTVLTDQEAEVIITATSWDGALSKSTAMTIYRPQVESITFEPVDWVEPYQSVQLYAHVKAVNDFVNQLVTWSVDSDNSDVWIDQNGLLYTGYSGWHNTITVTATADNGVSASMQISVVSPTVDFELPGRIALQTGDSYTVRPENVDTENQENVSEYYQRFSLSLGNNALAGAEDMTLTGLKPGQTDLTVTSWNGEARTVKLLVYDPIETVDAWVDPAALPNAVYPTDVLVQKTYDLRSLAVSSREYADDLVTWSSSDPSVIRVDDVEKGVIRTVNYGTAVITATAVSGAKKDLTLTVRKEVDTFTLPQEITAHVLADKVLEVESITPEDAWDGFTWQVEPAELGVIEGNILHVTAAQPTQGRLIATSWDGYVTKETVLSVIQEPVTAIAIDPVDTLNVGDEAQLIARVSAGAAYINRFVTFTSDNAGVVSVDANGVVHAHAPGTAVITATAPGETICVPDEETGELEIIDTTVTASVTIEVIRGVDSFTLPQEIYLQTGDEVEITLSDVLPEDSLQTFTWHSSQEDSLLIEDQNLSATLIARGDTARDVEVTVTSWNGVSRSMTVHVYGEVTDIRLKGMPAGAAPDQQIQLSAQVQAGGVFGNEIVRFSSSDESIAEVDDQGLVTALDYGRVEIIAQAGGVTCSETLRVTVPMEDFTLPVRFLAAAGTTIELSANDVLPAGADPEAIVWTLEPAELGVIEGNRFTAAMVENLTGTVTATGWDGSVVKTAVLQVYKPQVTDLSIDSVPALWVGAQHQLIARVFADGTEFINELVTFTSSNEDIVTVDENGLITCHNAYDSATITVTAENGMSASVNVYVNWPITDFTVDESFLMEVGAQRWVSIHSYQGDACGWFYASADEAVATVDENGRITATGAGETEITVRAYSGLERTVRVTVHDPVEQVIIDPVPENLRMIDTLQLNVRVLADREYGDELVTWTSSDPRVASVDAQGLVTTYSYGEVTITATAENGMSAGVFLRVAREVASFTLPEEFTGYVLSDLPLNALTIAPENAHGVFQWTVEPAEIGVVEGNVLHIAAEEACEGMLTAVSWDGNVTRTAALRILREDVTDVQIAAPENTEVLCGEQLQLTALVTAGMVYENRFVTWRSGDETVLTVDETGLVTVLAPGEATVTAEAENGLCAEVTLQAVQGVESFDVPQTLFAYYYRNESTPLPITNVTPANAEDRPFTYTVEPEGIVTVENGMITPIVGMEYGQAYQVSVTVTSWNGVSRTTEVTVKYPEIQKVTFDPLPERLCNGMSFPLVARVTVDGVEYINRFVSLNSHVEYEGGSSLEAYNYGSLNAQTGMVTLTGSCFDLYFSASWFEGMSTVGGNTVEYALEDFEITLPNVPAFCGQQIPLTVSNPLPTVASTDVTWSVEPQDAAIVEDGVLTILTREAEELTLTATSWNNVVRTRTLQTVAVQDVTSFTLPGRILLPLGGETELRFASLEPAGVSMDNFSWTLEPAGEAEIRDGRLVSLGNTETTVTLTATSWNGLTQSTTVLIYAPNVTAIELQPMTLWNRDQFQMQAVVTVDGKEYVNEYVTFAGYVDGYPIENDGGASMSADGLLRLDYFGGGYITVVATAQNGCRAEMQYRVYNKLDSITLKDTYVIRLGASANVYLEDYEPKTYGSPNLYQGEAVGFTVENGAIVNVMDVISSEYVVLYAWQVGETVLTATTRNGVTATARVVVYDEVEEVSIAPVGPQRIYERAQLTASVTANGMLMENQLVTWSSSDESIVTVNENGLARTVGYGTAVITATAENGVSDSVEVTVYEDTLSFTLPQGLCVTYGGTLPLQVNDFEPATGLQAFTWTVEPAGAAKVENDTLIPLVNETCEITLTATSWDGVSSSAAVSILEDLSRSTLILPAALTEIGEEAFAGTTAMAVRIPAGCRSIGARAFADAARLKEVYIPAGVTQIAPDAFTGSDQVTIVAPEGSTAQAFAQAQGIPFRAE